MANGRLHRSLFRYYMNIADELTETEISDFEKALERAIELNPKDLAVKFYKGLMLKMTDRKKEGNKLLRSLDLADGSTDNTEFTHDIQTLGYYYNNQGKLDL